MDRKGNSPSKRVSEVFEEINCIDTTNENVQKPKSYQKIIDYIEDHLHKRDMKLKSVYQNEIDE